MFCVSSDLNSGKKVRVFHWGGGVLCQIPEQGCSAKIWSKFSGSLAGCCIADSLSHTTYVETNKRDDTACTLLVRQRLGGAVVKHLLRTNMTQVEVLVAATWVPLCVTHGMSFTFQCLVFFSIGVLFQCYT